ncbi:MAG: DUF1116 domain-containing protein [Chloroflexi bacterium]|nr:MAG: DUF1116 domain-containing protein [Chloroflexota bacterium]TMG17249.1 MAG: DUF1116 domain-containing protein [Chloroflexota bacterium]TMG21851.1 MAG: DUF1116 domain-containing protein [Chloroflexota bacterium]
MTPRDSANTEAVHRLAAADPVLVDVLPLSEAVPDFDPRTVLASGASLRWEGYVGGQRNGILGGAVHEGLAENMADAADKVASGQIQVRPCGDYRCVGSLAGIYTASMPVLVVENRAGSNRAFCNLFEGVSRHRLNYGVYNSDVERNLCSLRDVIGPTIGEAVRAAGGVPLLPIMKRALHMGDELHSRNTAATLLFTRELFEPLMQLQQRMPEPVKQTMDYLRSSDYFFLRLSMASSRAAADAAHGITGSSVVTGMVFNCREFAIRVSGLGNDWFRGPLPRMAGARLFDGFTESDIEFMGGESTFNETAGLGGFAQAAAFPLQEYQGGSAQRMVEANLAMYEITLGEHPELRIPYLGFRGVPIGIDIRLVVEKGITPVLDIGVAGKDGGQIGAGSFTASIECFELAATAYAELTDR